VSKYRQPVKGSFLGYEIISMGPPSSGGLLVVHMLNMLEKIIEEKNSDFDLSFNSVNYIHTLTELERRAYADRTEHMADSDYWNVPNSMFLSHDYAHERLKDIDFKKATDSQLVEHGNPYSNQSEETTHYSIIDSEGNAVSVTTTINSGYGNGITVTGAGFLLNNEMDDFSSKPGEPNMFGLLGNEANAIEAKKRPLSSMTPTIVLKDGSPFLILGSPGGSTIITTVMQNILNVIVHNMNIQEAVSSPRVHSQWLPDMVFHEKNGLSPEIIDELKKMGHDVRMRGSIGEANGIMINEKGFWGGPDSRGENTAIGY
jgi:gamma-glutamyltranspeptidase/glutathione hydrolase